MSDTLMSADVGAGAAGPSFSPLYQQIKVLILRSLQMLARLLLRS